MCQIEYNTNTINTDVAIKIIKRNYLAINKCHVRLEFKKLIYQFEQTKKKRKRKNQIKNLQHMNLDLTSSSSRKHKHKPRKSNTRTQYIMNKIPTNSNKPSSIP